MSAYRRSARLSNTNLAEIGKTTPTRSRQWRQTQKNDSSDEEEDLVRVTTATTKTSVLKERDDNARSSMKHQSSKSKNKLSTSDELDDSPGVSPPKLSRRGQQPIAQQQLVSPSRLIDRLSIDKSDDEDDDNEDNDDKEKEKRPPARNKYQSARRVLNSAETENLPGREEQLQELREFFMSHLQQQTSGSLYVSGQPGTGKTACLSLLLHSREISKSLKCAYINCTSIASVGSVYKKICTELSISADGLKTERDHLDAIKRHLCKSKRMNLIVLDEIDQLCTSRQSVLYTIFEWPSLAGARLLLVGIANSLDLTDRALVRLNARCELKPRLMHFPPYTKQQIVEIFRARLERAGVLEVFPPVTLQLLAAKVSAVSGDVRRALDIGRRVVEIAEQQKKAGKRVVNLNEFDIDKNEVEKETGTGTETENETLKPVQVSQVVEVLNKVYGVSQNLNEDIEESFPLQQKLVLCSLMLMLRNEKNKDITMGRLHEVYRRVCNKRNICALDHAEFSGLLDLVETRGILRIMRKKESRLSKVQLQWDEDEVNAALSDKQLIATILNDTACLRSGA